jgi:hypothetical protein
VGGRWEVGRVVDALISLPRCSNLAPKTRASGHLESMHLFSAHHVGNNASAKKNVYFVIWARWDDRDEGHATPAIVFSATTFSPALSLTFPPSFLPSFRCLRGFLSRRILSV